MLLLGKDGKGKHCIVVYHCTVVVNVAVAIKTVDEQY